MEDQSIGELFDASAFLDKPTELNRLYERDGYLFLRSTLDVDEIERVYADLSTVLKRQGAIESAASNSDWTGASIDAIDDNDLYRLKSYQELCESQTTMGVLDRVFGQPVYIFRSTTIRFSLPEDDLHITPPHQDHFFIGPNDDFRTVWIPLMNISPEVGGLCVALGSHKAGIREHIEDEHYESYILRGRKQKGVPLDSITEEWLTTTYRPGDVLIFHSHTIHRALPNRSRYVRLSLDTRAQPASTSRSFQSRRTILEQRNHRAEVQRLAFEEGATESQFEAIVHEMLKNGVEPDRAVVQEALASLS